MNVCVIPARGGSKRIPKKNIKNFHGKPIIAYSIETAINSKLFEKVMVTTDDEKIKNVAERYGAEVPFTRPANLADDHATTLDVLQHAAQWVSDNLDQVKYMCCIYPTAPLLQPEDLQGAFGRLTESSTASYCYSITSFEFPVFRAVSLDSQRGVVTPLFPKYSLARSQDLPPAYHDAGQFYWGKVSAFAKRLDFFGQSSLGYRLPSMRVVDIDEPEDWEKAEFLYEYLEKQGRPSR